MNTGIWMPKRGKVLNHRVSTATWPRTKARKGFGWERKIP